jgi:hypothetical protein
MDGRSWRRLSLAVCAAACLGAAAVRGQVPAPAIEWSEWQPVTTCGDVEYQLAVTRDDGRNEFQLRLRARNLSGHLVATRFAATIISKEGKKKYREGGGRINPGRTIEGGTFNFGQLFETPVNAALPVGLSRVEFTLVETANVEKPLVPASPSTYLSDFRDFPKTPCAAFVHSFADSAIPRFMQLTNACALALPNWLPACQDAVEEILRYAKSAPPSALPCLKEWRAYQQCYGSYAYGPNPNPKPECLERVPRCNIR